MELHIDVKNKIATYQKRDGDIVCGNSDYTLKFTFDEEWAAHEEKTARFFWNGKYFDQDFTGDTCDVPVIQDASACLVGVYAGDLSTTTPARIGCRESILDKGDTPHPESGQHYTSEAKAAAEAAKASQEAAALSETNAAKSETNAATSEVNAKESETAAAGSASAAEASASAAKASEEVALGIAADAVNMDARITRNDKRITNLEQGLMADAYETDASVAYAKDAPANALPFAAVSQIGGMTRKCTNLAVPNAVQYSGFGYTLTPNTNGTLAITGACNTTEVVQLDVLLRQADGTHREILLEAGKSYTFTRLKNGVSVSDIGVRIDYTDAAGGTVWTWNGQDTSRPRKLSLVYLRGTFSTGDTSFVGTYTFMLNEGATALPYEPYFEGLRDSKVTAIRSVGKNLLNVTKCGTVQTQNGITAEYLPEEDCFLLNGTATTYAGPGWYMRFPLKKNTNYTLQAIPVSGTVTRPNGTDFAVAYVGRYVNGASVNWFLTNLGSTKATTATGYNDATSTELARLWFYCDPGVVYDNYKVRVQLEEGAAATDYEPYTEHTLAVPDAVQALKGYGEGVDANVYNFIDWRPEDGVRRFVKNTARIEDLGAISWGGDPVNYNYCYSFLKGAKVGAKYVLSAVPAGITGTYYNAGNTAFMVNFEKGTFADAAAIAAAFSGVSIEYELATAEETDLSDLLTDDNLIEVEGGGTILAENEYRHDVSTEITYQLKQTEEV